MKWTKEDDKARQAHDKIKQEMCEEFEKEAAETFETMDILMDLQEWCLNQSMKAKSKRAKALISKIENWAEERTFKGK